MARRHDPLVRSMFLRRLLLLAAAAGVGIILLAVQAARLTVGQHSRHLAEAESRLLSERWTPTVRGRILDRRGRVLAFDRPAFDVMVDYRVITGEWAERAAGAHARSTHADRWPLLDETERKALVGEARAMFDDRLDAFWVELAEAIGVGRAELDERRGRIERSVERMANAVWNARLRQRRAELNRGREVAIEVTLDDVKDDLREQREPHALATGVDEEIAFRVRRLAERYDWLTLDQGGKRTYPFESVTVDIDRGTFPPPLRDEEGAGAVSVTVRGVATHVVGWMRDLWREDVAGRPRNDADTGLIDRGHYRPGDRVGSTGVEASLERSLRGLRGHVVTHRDTEQRDVTPPEAGRDVHLTLDVMLQARIQAALSPELGLARVQPWHATRQGLPMPVGTPLNGAAVVLEIDSGDILAMVSMPTFTRGEFAENADDIMQDRLNAAWLNRAVARPYAPGSIVKPLVLAAAVTEGAHHLDHAVACTGHLLENRPDRFRCWIYKQYNTTHTDQLGGPLHGREAIGVSCNIYFYTLGRALGVGGTRRWFARFGVGEEFGLGIGDEYAGNAGDKYDGTPMTLGDAILLGIGQGPIAWTPLHAADTYATLARGGQRITPRLRRDAPVRAGDLGLDAESLDEALAGLDMSVNDELGTGEHITFPDGSRTPMFDAPGVRVIGKTGTATANPVLGEDPDGPGPEARPVLRSGDHAWFVVLAGAEGGLPRYAVSVVVEFAGSGGRVAGPVANQVIHALAAEGYL